jgi:hypothetical protein
MAIGVISTIVLALYDLSILSGSQPYFFSTEVEVYISVDKITNPNKQQKFTFITY